MPATVPVLWCHAVSTCPSSFIAPIAVLPDTAARHLDVVADSGATTLTMPGWRSVLRGDRPCPNVRSRSRPMTASSTRGPSRRHQRVDSFADPYGYADPRVRRAVRDTGSSSAGSVKNVLSAPAEPGSAISRLMVRATTIHTDMPGWLRGARAPLRRADERPLTRGLRAWRSARARLHSPATGWTDAV